VWQARKLYKNASTLEDLKQLGVTEALLKFGVVVEKKPQAGTKAASVKKNKDENAEAVPASDKEAEKPNETPEQSEKVEEATEATHKSDEDGGDPTEADEQPADNLADEEEKELKAYQESIRKLTPKTRAVAIHHALELLREELDGEEVDEELQQTICQIAQLAEELKGLNSHDEQNS
jgi:hypothetical protein